MDFAVVGGDVRFAYLTRMLASAGWDARAVDGMRCDVLGVRIAEREALAEARNVVMQWPEKGVLEKLAPGTRVYFCGPKSPERIPEEIVGIDLWKDERLLLENAWLTAEGAVCAAMNAAKASLKDCSCLIIGWGRIGRALTELLVGLNARVTVASRSPKGRNGAIERGAESVSTYNMVDALPGKEIIFSTPPQRVLDSAKLERVDPGAMVIDLSSAPYGVDIEEAKSLGVNAWREPKLPGRYCPYSAARAIMQAMIRAEEA